VTERSRFDAIVQGFKESEQPECLLLISEDPANLKIAAAWTGIRIERRNAARCPRDDAGDELWDWLWDGVSYSFAEIALRTGLSTHLVERRLPGLIANKVIYPDGTVNSFVQRFLREQVLKLFRAAAKKPTRSQ